MRESELAHNHLLDTKLVHQPMLTARMKELLTIFEKTEKVKLAFKE